MTDISHETRGGLMANYLAVGAWALVALLLVANITLRIGTLTIIPSDRQLSEPQFPGPTQTVVTAPTPAPDQSTTVSAPEVGIIEPEVLGTIEPAIQSRLTFDERFEPATNLARAETPTKKSVARQQPPIKQPQLGADSLSNKAY
jgi:hypothetical protein